MNTPYQEYKNNRHDAKDLTVIFLIVLVSYFVIKYFIQLKQTYTE